MIRIDAVAKLRHGLQSAAFCLVIATVQYAFRPEKSYGQLTAYSLAIGMCIWAIVDLGRNFFPSAEETGWPAGYSGIGLVVVGIVGGYWFGNGIGDFLCRTFGLYAGPPPDLRAEMRNGMMVTLLAGIAGSYYLYSAGKSSYLERKMGEARQHADEARLKLLETQLEPHMLFNTLANLRVLIAVDPPRAQQMLDHMIAYLRATLAASRATTHPLQAEFDRLRDYLELMAIRMGPRLKYTLDLPGALAQEKVPSLLLQPLVENAIQHGLEPKVGGGEIRVAARREGEHVVLDVCDTGVGLSTTQLANANGFGTRQVRERLATLYGERASIEFADVDAGGCRVVVRYPVQTAA